MTATTFPSSAVRPSATLRRTRIAGLVVSGIAVLFLAWDAAMKLFLVPQAVDGTVSLGYPLAVLRPIGIAQLVCLVLYVVPRTAPLGAILFTGYLGGAVATHVRLENPLFSHILFPTYVAALLWGGLWLRDPRVRALLRPATAISLNR